MSLIKVDARGSGRRASCTNEHNKGFQEVLLYPLKKLNPSIALKPQKGEILGLCRGVFKCVFGEDNDTERGKLKKYKSEGIIIRVTFLLFAYFFSETF